MPSIISPDQMRSFAERGYVVLPDVVPKPLIEAARRRVDDLVHANPPPTGHRGFHFYWESQLSDIDPLVAPLFASCALDLATTLVTPLELVKPDQAQVSLNIPVWDRRPGGPHIDGLTPPEPSGRPGTFTMLAGIFLTDQPVEDMGNLWVWPGSHHAAVAYLRERGPDAIFDIVHPTYEMAAPEQVTGRAGDLYLGHYLLGHNMGANTSEQTRQVVYFRLQAAGHRERWRECMQDPLREFEPVRSALEQEIGGR
jgi:phytanoyl-CoA dioxygenase PhyH